MVREWLAFDAADTSRLHALDPERMVSGARSLSGKPGLSKPARTVINR
jgi:hypothetical protein